ncbi:MAG: sensor histidine kinase [Lachnospiraceae bacterium]|jgi:two-component system sensor histidine kinase YesM|nr:sensor histidine kinase [Lachnospiraceae bacterium]
MGILTLLLMELAAVVFVYTLFINGIRNDYINLVYDSSDKLVAQYAIRFTQRMKQYDALSASFSSDENIRRDIRTYTNAAAASQAAGTQPEGSQAEDSLTAAAQTGGTQTENALPTAAQAEGAQTDAALTSAQAAAAQAAALGDMHNQMYWMAFHDSTVEFLSFEFDDGKSVIAGDSRNRPVLESARAEILALARANNGRIGWYIPAQFGHTGILYQLIKDPSVYGMPSRGVLMAYVDFDAVFGELVAGADEENPELVCLTDGKLLFREGTAAAHADLRAAIGESAGVAQSEEALGAGVTQAGGSSTKPVQGSGADGKVLIDGDTYFISAKPLAYGDFILGYLQAEEGVLRGFYQVNRKFIVGAALLGFLVLALGAAASLSLTRPLRALTWDMEKATRQGDIRPRPDGAHFPKPEILSREFRFREVQALADSYTHLIARIDTLIHEVYDKELANMEIRYRILQQNIRPHFLYNTLDTINWKAIMAGNGEVAQMVRSLSHLLRVSLSGPDMVTLGEELVFLQEYLTIQQMRFGERLVFDSCIDPLAMGCPIPRLTLQPLVENCICHNLEKKSAALHVELKAAAHGDTDAATAGTALITVTDDGTGAVLADVLAYLAMGKPEEPSSHSDGIGLYNINQRLLLAFGEGYGLTLDLTETGGMKVSFPLPMGIDGPAGGTRKGST